MAAAVLWANLSIALGDLGLGFSLAYFAAKRPSAGLRLWHLALVVAGTWGSILTVLAILVLPRVTSVVGPASAYAAMPAIPLGLAAGYQAYLLLGAGRVRAHNVVRLVGASTYACGVVAAWAASASAAWSFAACFTLSQAAAALMAALLLRGATLQGQRQGLPLREVLTYGLKAHVASIASHLSLRLDQALLSLFLPAEQLGLYVVAVALAGLPGPLFTGVAVYVIPRTAAEPSAVVAARLTVSFTWRTLAVRRFRSWRSCTPPLS
jgi:hypothetical protein